MRFLLLSLLVACSSSGTPTGATCQSQVAPLTYENFGRNFMTTYCTGCHSGDVQGGSRHGAPSDDNFDTLDGVMAAATEIDGLAGIGPSARNSDMPPEECTTCKIPTADERTQLAAWLACERSGAK